MRSFSSQRGGTFLGFILGLVLGLGVALAVAIYVTKVPTPFSNKNQPRSNEQDVVESQKNKDWNPNGVLQPKAPASAAETAPQPEGDAVTPAPTPAATPTPPGVKPEPKAEPKAAAVSADPLGDLVKAKGGLSTPAVASTESEPFQYFVQVGAYRSMTEADGQKARLAMMGLEAKVSEREQAGRTVYRVRLGPYADKALAERVGGKLEASQIEHTLVRIQR